MAANGLMDAVLSQRERRARFGYRSYRDITSGLEETEPESGLTPEEKARQQEEKLRKRKQLVDIVRGMKQSKETV
jgi:hypothetical protein